MASRESELWNEVSALLDAREGWSLQSSPTPGVPPTWGFVSEGGIELSVGIEEGLVAVYLVDRGVVITAPDVGGLTPGSMPTRSCSSSAMPWPRSSSTSS